MVQRFYEFGRFRLDGTGRVLFRGDQAVPLSPKAADVLLLLVQNSGSVVEKKELLNRVWHDAFVEEDSLTRTISILRKLLEAGYGGLECIATVSKRGYRFVVPAGARSKSSRDQNYRDAMAAAYAQHPDDETTLFYGLSILGAVPEGSHGFEQHKKAARLVEAVYARHPDHPGPLHYLIHAYDDPVHAQEVLPAARAYAPAAAAIPHALRMPSHIFTRLGYWNESGATNLKGWEVSEADDMRTSN